MRSFPQNGGKENFRGRRTEKKESIEKWNKHEFLCKKKTESLKGGVVSVTKRKVLWEKE